MKTEAFAVFLCLVVFGAQAQLGSRSSKCKCSNSYVGRINLQIIKAEPVIHYPSVFCPNTEIIITTTADKQKCVNPNSLFGKLILKNHRIKHGKKGSVSMTTASSSTTPQTSATLNTQ